ncbi:MAG: VOC family protein [Planctomycetota bacterium]|nr:VOC family protein [Planctomycetota bacterium]MDA1138941.1 VOC family protein [Planctomycetota bacterium]
MNKSLLVHIGIRATNLEASVRFWRDALGLSVAQITRETCYDLTDGYHNFRLFQHQGPERPPHVSGMLDYLHLGVRVPCLKEAAERCKAMGFDIIYEGLGGEVKNPDYIPNKEFKVEDPDGIVVDITEKREQWPGVDIEEKG